jgi:triacylglycerol esterase/lipase EstA (alpha/beta hydrolase family)
MNKVHLIGHSMGGQTIRMLAQLLAHGTHGAPVEEDLKSHTIFEGGHNWIHSITTISTPNLGTLLCDGFARKGEAISNFVVSLFALAGAFGDGSCSIFDAKLDHWGILPRKIQENESLKDYVDRIFKSRLFQPGFEDVCIHSLSTQGAIAENKWVKTLPNIYYYSFSTQDTNQVVDQQLPRVCSMILPLQPLAAFIGGQFVIESGFSSAWQINDGVVNTISMKSDGQSIVVDFFINQQQEEQVVNLSATSKCGQWHHVALFTCVDHAAIIGFKWFMNNLDLYHAHLKLLLSLPTTSDVQGIVVQHPVEILKELHVVIQKTNGLSKEKALLDFAKTWSEWQIDGFLLHSIKRSSSRMEKSLPKLLMNLLHLNEVYPHGPRSTSPSSFHRHFLLEFLPVCTLKERSAYHDKSILIKSQKFHKTCPQRHLFCRFIFFCVDCLDTLVDSWLQCYRKHLGMDSLDAARVQLGGERYFYLTHTVRHSSRVFYIPKLQTSCALYCQQQLELI